MISIPEFQTKRVTEKIAISLLLMAAARQEGPLLGVEDWQAVRVWTGREASVGQALTFRGYQVFCPAYQIQDARRIKSKVLFPGYCFCRAAREVVGKIITAPGVLKLVGNVSANELAAIQRVLEAGVLPEPVRYLPIGARVRITGGPLQGLEGVLEKIKTRERLVLSVTILQRSVGVEIDSAARPERIPDSLA